MTNNGPPNNNNFPKGSLFEGSLQYFKEFKEGTETFDKLHRRLQNCEQNYSDIQNASFLSVDTTNVNSKIAAKIYFLEHLETNNNRNLRRIKRLLESSIELGGLILTNCPAQQHRVGLNGSIVSKVQKELSPERTDLNMVPQLKLLTEVATSNKINKKLSIKFWEGFFIHWRHCTHSNLLQTEWTALIRSSGSFAQFYIDTFCPETLEIFYGGSKLFATQEKKRRPDICIQVQNKPYLVALCEVAVEYFEDDMEHKDDVTLFKRMRRALDEQLKTLLPEDTGVFGVLQGERKMCAFFMTAIKEKEDAFRYSVSLITPTLIDLMTVEGCFAYYKLLCMFEHRAKYLKQARTLTKPDLVLPPLLLERWRKTRGSTTPSKPDKQTKKSGDKKDNNNNAGNNTNVRKLELQLSEFLYGRLSAIQQVDTKRALREARYYADQIWHEVVLVTKQASDDREIQFLKSFNCNKIVRYFESCVNTQENGSTYILVLEKLAPVPKIRNTKKFLSFCQDVIEGIVYLHDNNVIHRDIKPSNIGYHRQERTYKIFDFNIATRLYERSDYKSFSQDIGTEGYQAPEVVRVDPKKGYDFKADIYSLGVTLKELNKYAQAPIDDLVAKCLLENPEERPTARELLQAIKQLR